jgi:hypothetical protein
MRHLRMQLTLVFSILFAAQLAMAGDLPDPTLTPGAINADVTQENIDENICVSGWTKTVRPKTPYTNKLKKQQIVQYGYSDTAPAHYEEDHLISLQLGGNPTDPKNLWPQPYDGTCNARTKDVLETKLKRLVCDGAVSLQDAQQAISSNWIEAYKLYVKPEGCGNQL